MCRRAWEFVENYSAWADKEQFLVQILVVVAMIQMRSLKTEVGKGSKGNVLYLGLVDPNC